MITAEIVLDSISPAGQRLTTMLLRYPKFIHGEFMTHRVFSRNASSSRAIPTTKLLQEVRSDAERAAPIFWGKNQAGMQAVEELADPSWAIRVWSYAAISASAYADQLLSRGVHKQIVNRILEPFLHINTLVSATEYDNFHGLRLDAAAQPEMRALAEAMWMARKNSEPTLLQPGEWHLPFVDAGHPIPNIGYVGADSLALARAEDDDVSYEELAKRVSVARCARLSYMSNVTNKRSAVVEDLELYDRLVGSHPMHASPAEHQATPDAWSSVVGWALPHEHGNFRGWRQYRKMIPGEQIAPLPKEFY